MLVKEAWIYSDYVSEFVVRIEKLNRKAIRLGASKIILTVTSETKIEKIEDKEKNTSYEFHFTKVIVEGETPKLNGWSLVATLVHDSELGLMINVVPNKTLDPKYRNSTGFCDHCKTNRFRKETFVVEHENGELKEVGRQCIADFLGSDKIGKFIWALNWPKMFESLADNFDREYGGRVQPVFNIRTFLATSVMAIKEHGYISKTKAQDSDLIPTASHTINYYDGNRYNNIPPYRPTTVEYEMADKVIEWAKTIDISVDYNYNINKIALNEHCGYRFAGYATSMIASYNKAMDLIRMKEAKKDSEFVGIISKREVMDLKFVNQYGWETMYGFQNCYKFEDYDGNVIVWKSLTDETFEKDTIYKVKATYKKHVDYKEIKQTEVSRLSII
jgi:hypothetical protein